MTYAIGFDVYGTLIDPLLIAQSLRPFAAANSDPMAQLWRTKQLEYSYRRATMGSYQSFDVCTQQALLYAASSFAVELTAGDQARLLGEYRKLPAYEDALSGVKALAGRGHRLVAFSNGVEATVRELLEHAGIMSLLEGVVSVDDLKTFKPDPRVYDYLVRRTKKAKSDTWVVSSNPFDVIGAKAAGLRAIWVKRRANVEFDPWGIEPDLIVKDLRELAEAWR